MNMSIFYPNGEPFMSWKWWNKELMGFPIVGDPRYIRLILLTSLMLFVGCHDKPPGWGNLPPEAPSDPIPANGASRVPLEVSLNWQCSDPDGDELRYDLYFGVSMDPPLVDYDLMSGAFVLGHLDEATYYYWKVLAKDDHGNRTESPLWTFSTGISPTISHVATYHNPDGIYRFWVRDGLVYNIPITGLEIVDAIGFDPPRVIGNYTPPDTATYYSDMSIRDDYAYLSVVSGPGLHIIDIIDPVNPVYAGGWSGDSTSYAAALSVEGNYAYIAAGDTAELYTIDISNQLEPILVNTYEFQWATMLGWDILVSGGYAFVVHYGRGYERYDYVTILDVSNPVNPVELAHISTYDIVRNIVVCDNHLYIPYAFDGFLRVFDLAQPTSPELIAVFPSGEGIFGVFVNEEYGYLANYNSGLQVIDVSDPANPTFVVGSDTGEGAVDIFVDGNYIYYSDGQDDLYVSYFAH